MKKYDKGRNKKQQLYMTESKEEFKINHETKYILN